MSDTLQPVNRGSNSRNAVPAARVEGLVTTQAGDEVLVYDNDRHQIHHLNKTSALVWRLCDGTRSVGELAIVAAAETGQELDSSTVQLAVSKLSDAGLLIHPVTAQTRTSAHNRRKFMKRAVVAGIALPVVVSITAPGAAEAASVGSPCCCNKDCNFSNGLCLGGGAPGSGVCCQASTPGCNGLGTDCGGLHCP